MAKIFQIVAANGKYPYNEGKHLIIAFELEAYGDESGTQGNPKYCLLLGFVGAPLVWESFNIAWNAILSKYNVQEFHATHFFHLERCQSHEYQYKDWTSARRLEYLKALLLVIASHQIVPVGWAVDVGAFNSLTLEDRRYLTGAYLETTFHGKSLVGVGNPFSMSFQRKFKTSGAQSRPYMFLFGRFFHDVLEISPPDALIHVILDCNQLAPIANETFCRMWKGKHPGGQQFDTLTYADSKTKPQLQAADLLAYSWHRSITSNNVSNEIVCVNKSLRDKKDYVKVAHARFFASELRKLTQAGATS